MHLEKSFRYLLFFLNLFSFLREGKRNYKNNNILYAKILSNSLENILQKNSEKKYKCGFEF